VVERIISGGQTGADRAGLEAGLELGLPIGGHCPKGRRAEDGRVPRRYPLTPTGSSDYRQRTRLNVERSDATVVFTFGPLTSGSRLTVRCAQELEKPVLHVDLDRPNAVAQVRAFLEAQAPRVLNIAGSRESSAPGIFQEALEALTAALS
jgi:hypothetical protein